MSDDEGYLPQETKNVLKEVVQAVLVLDHSKKPFKRSDIVSHMSQNPGRRDWKEIFRRATKRLTNLGLEIHQTKDKKAKMYFVVNKANTVPTMYKYATEEEISNRTLVTLVLAYIFMKNGTVVSDDLLKYLKSLNIYDEANEIHPYFGNVKKKVLSEFVEQLYLSVTKIPDSDLLEITWGERAELEVTKRSILEFVCQCGYGNQITPNNFPYHYEKVLEQEAEEASDTNSVADLSE